MAPLDTGPPPENERTGARPAADSSENIATGISDSHRVTPAPTPEPDEDFDWSTDDSVIITEQPETALYWNSRHQIVIRQRGWPGDDSFVYFNRAMLPHLIAMLQAEEAAS